MRRIMFQKFALIIFVTVFSPLDVAAAPIGRAVNPAKDPSGMLGMTGASNHISVDDLRRVLHFKIVVEAPGSRDTVADAVITAINELFDVEGVDFKLVRHRTDSSGYHHIRLRQHYRDIPVLGGSLIVHLNPDNTIFLLSGRATDAFNLSTEPKISVETALASGYHTNLVGACDKLEEPPSLVIVNGILAYQYAISTRGENYHRWSFHIDAQTGDTLRVEDTYLQETGYWIDKETPPPTSEPDWENYTMTGCLADGHRFGNSTCSERPLRVDGLLALCGDQYYLFNHDNRWGVLERISFEADYEIMPLDWDNEEYFRWAYQNYSNNWVDDWHAKAAFSSAYHIDTVQQYSTEILGRDSFDDEGTVVSVVFNHYSHDCSGVEDDEECYACGGAGWTQNSIKLTLGDWNPDSHTRCYSKAVLDTIAHEFGHGITNSTSKLGEFDVYAGDTELRRIQDEAYALSESYSDIFAFLVELEVYKRRQFNLLTYGRPTGPWDDWTVTYTRIPETPDWLQGEDAYAYDPSSPHPENQRYAARDMAEPASLGLPSYYNGIYWAGPNASDPYHTNVTVQNHAFYILATGGSGTNYGKYGASGYHQYEPLDVGNDPMEAIKIAGEIAMYANLNFLSEYSDFQHSADAWVLAARALYKPSTDDPNALAEYERIVDNVVRAWDAVGIETTAQHWILPIWIPYLDWYVVTKISIVDNLTSNTRDMPGISDGKDQEWQMSNHSDVPRTLHVKVCPIDGDAILAFIDKNDDVLDWTNVAGAGECEVLSAQVPAFTTINVVVDTHGDDQSFLGEYSIKLVWGTADVLFVSNGYYDQEAEIQAHLEANSAYNVTVLDDYSMYGDTDLSQYDLIVVTGFSPNISDAGIQNILSSEKPVFIVEYWDYWYSYKMGLVSSDWCGTTMTDTIEVIEHQHYITAPLDQPATVYGSDGMVIGVPMAYIEPGATPLAYGSSQYDQVTLISDEQRNIVASGMNDVSKLTTDGWDLFDRGLEYALIPDQESGCLAAMTEDFTDSELPVGWNIEDGEGDGYTWHWTDSDNNIGNGAEGGYYLASSFAAPGMDLDEELITHRYRSRNCSSVNLSFNHLYRHSQGDAAEVAIQVGLGEWQTIATYTSDVTEHASINIDPYIDRTSVFRFRFRYTATDGNKWKVDDMRIHDTP